MPRVRLQDPVLRKTVLFLALMSSAGCTTVKVYREPVRTLCEVGNSAWYLFGRYPIASGDPDRPNERSCRFFEDTLNLETNDRLLRWALEREGAERTGNVEERLDTTVVVPAILKRRTLQTFAELLYGTGSGRGAANGVGGRCQQG